MRLAGRRNRPERAGSQRGVSGEFAVAHERRDLPDAAILFDDGCPVGDRWLVDAVDRNPHVGGVVVVALGVATHVQVGQREHGVAGAVLEFAQALGEMRHRFGEYSGRMVPTMASL